MALCLAIGVVGATVAALTSQAEDWRPLSLVLALAAFNVATEVLHVRHERKPGEEDWVITSTAPLALAMALLGPAPAAAIALLGLTASEFYRPGTLQTRISNLAIYATFVVSGAVIFEWLAGAWGLTADEPGFAALVMGIYFYGGVLSYVLNAASGALFWGESIGRQLRTEAQWPIVDAICAPLAAATAYSYATVGLGALGALALVQLAHQYLMNNLLLSQRRADALEKQTERLTELSASRGRLVSQVLQAEEAERRRLAEALHDEALQNLLTAMRGLGEPTNGGIDHARTGIQRTIDQLRGAIFNLHPDVLEQAGLPAALRAVARQEAERGGFQAEIEVDPEATGHHDRLLFVLGREQLTNAAKHSGATEVTVVVSRSDGVIVMDVKDNGCGIDPDRRHTALEKGHIGLATSAERVEALGGQLEIESESGGGTLIRTRLPLAAGSSNGTP